MSGIAVDLIPTSCTPFYFSSLTSSCLPQELAKWKSSAVLWENARSSLARFLATVLSRNSVGRSRGLACPEGCSTCSLVPFAYHCLGCSMLLVSRCGLVASSITCEAASLDTCPPSVVHWTSNYWQKMLVAFSLLLRTIHHSKSVFKFFSKKVSFHIYSVVLKPIWRYWNRFGGRCVLSRCCFYYWLLQVLYLGDGGCNWLHSQAGIRTPVWDSTTLLYVYYSN